MDKLFAFCILVILVTIPALYQISLAQTLLCTALFLGIAVYLTVTEAKPGRGSRPVQFWHRGLALGLIGMLIVIWSYSGIDSADFPSMTMGRGLAMLLVGFLTAWLWPFDLLTAVFHGTSRRSLRAALIALIVAGVVLSVALQLPQWPVNSVADMLPAIIEASQRFLRGQNPYLEPYMIQMTFGVGPYYFSYLPFQWLVYAPFVGLELDLRWINTLLVVACLLLLAANMHQPVLWKALAAASLALHPWFVFMTVLHTEIMVVVFLFLCLAHLLYRRRLVLASAVYGLSLATSLWFLPPLPLLGAYLFRHIPRTRAWALVGVAAGTALALVVPFIAWSPTGFFGDFQYYAWDKTPKHLWDTERVWIQQLGFGGLFWQLGMAPWLPFIQIVIASALVVYAFPRLHSAEILIRYMAMLQLVFVSLNLITFFS